jgi:Protein of unknown function, DUF417
MTTIIPFMPDGWAASAGGFPAMQGNVAFLMKDVVLFAVSFYLLGGIGQPILRPLSQLKAGLKQYGEQQYGKRFFSAVT